MLLGDLRSFLRSKRVEKDDERIYVNSQVIESGLGADDFIRINLDIARGLEYLSKKKVSCSVANWLFGTGEVTVESNQKTVIYLLDHRLKLAFFVKKFFENANVSPFGFFRAVGKNREWGYRKGREREELGKVPRSTKKKKTARWGTEG